MRRLATTTTRARSRTARSTCTASGYYSFAPPEDVLTRIATRVEFFALDSTNLDRTQLQWLDERLTKSNATWKIVFFHHPPVHIGPLPHVVDVVSLPASSRCCGSTGVDVGFSGHEHLYERTQLEDGIQYFVSGGGGGVLRTGDATQSPYVAHSFDRDYHFMLIEIDGHELHFQAITRTGRTIDAGDLYKDGD
jgi:3',5'-cyclic AMP phosphodiesterase CpdA